MTIHDLVFRRRLSLLFFVLMTTMGGIAFAGDDEDSCNFKNFEEQQACVKRLLSNASHETKTPGADDSVACATCLLSSRTEARHECPKTLIEQIEIDRVPDTFHRGQAPSAACKPPKGADSLKPEELEAYYSINPTTDLQLSPNSISGAACLPQGSKKFNKYSKTDFLKSKVTEEERRTAVAEYYYHMNRLKIAAIATLEQLATLDAILGSPDAKACLGIGDKSVDTGLARGSECADPKIPATQQWCSYYQQKCTADAAALEKIASATVHAAAIEKQMNDVAAGNENLKSHLKESVDQLHSYYPALNDPKLKAALGDKNALKCAMATKFKDLRDLMLKQRDTLKHASGCLNGAEKAGDCKDLGAILGAIPAVPVSPKATGDKTKGDLAKSYFNKILCMDYARGEKSKRESFNDKYVRTPVIITGVTAIAVTATIASGGAAAPAAAAAETAAVTDATAAGAAAAAEASTSAAVSAGQTVTLLTGITGINGASAVNLALDAWWVYSVAGSTRDTYKACFKDADYLKNSLRGITSAEPACPVSTAPESEKASSYKACAIDASLAALNLAAPVAGRYAFGKIAGSSSKAAAGTTGAETVEAASTAGSDTAAKTENAAAESGSKEIKSGGKAVKEAEREVESKPRKGNTSKTDEVANRLDPKQMGESEIDDLKHKTVDSYFSDIQKVKGKKFNKAEVDKFMKDVEGLQEATGQDRNFRTSKGFDGLAEEGEFQAWWKNIGRKRLLKNLNKIVAKKMNMEQLRKLVEEDFNKWLDESPNANRILVRKAGKAGSSGSSVMRTVSNPKVVAGATAVLGGGTYIANRTLEIGKLVAVNGPVVSMVQARFHSLIDPLVQYHYKKGERQFGNMGMIEQNYLNSDAGKKDVKDAKEMKEQLDHLSSELNKNFDGMTPEQTAATLAQVKAKGIEIFSFKGKSFNANEDAQRAAAIDKFVGKPGDLMMKSSIYNEQILQYTRWIKQLNDAKKDGKFTSDDAKTLKTYQASLNLAEDDLAITLAQWDFVSFYMPEYRLDPNKHPEEAAAHEQAFNTLLQQHHFNVYAKNIQKNVQVILDQVGLVADLGNGITDDTVRKIQQSQKQK